MKLRHAAIGLALISASATADAHTCKSRTMNKGGIISEFKLEIIERTVKGKTEKKIKEGVLYLQTGEKLLVVSLPGPLVEDVLKKEGNLAGVVFANAKEAIKRYNKKKNIAQQWKCAEKPAELPAVEEETPAPKPSKGDDLIIPPDRPGSEKPSPPKLDPPKPAPSKTAPAEPSSESRGFSFTARDWEDARNRKTWLPFEVKTRPRKANEILDNGKPWSSGRMGALHEIAKSHVKQAFDIARSKNPYAPSGKLSIRLEVDHEGYAKNIYMQGAIERDLVVWLFNVFNKMVLTPDMATKPPTFTFIL